VRILQITPEGDALRGGVRATAEVVGRALAAARGLESDFVSGRELLSAGAPPAPRIVLHYVSYGYARRGCPWHLVRAVEGWRRSGQLRRLVTVFHELYASGPPWTSAFWLAPVQRSLGRRLARASHGLVTSLDFYRDILASWTGRNDVIALPVPSTVGEPEQVPGPQMRAPRLVVFGTAGSRARVYGEQSETLAAACRALGIEEIEDVGAPDPSAPETLAGIPVRRHGLLPSHAVGRLLLDARAGFLTYPPDLLGKSSIFAAYAAHGLVTVCAGRPARGPAGVPECALLADDVVEADRGSRANALDPATLAARAAATHAWYRQHAAARHAAAFAELIGA